VPWEQASVTGKEEHMVKKITAEYGSWKSPITSSLIVSGAIRFDNQVAVCNDDVYWTESRPTEDGRLVIVHWSPGKGLEDINPKTYNARTRVHEYGGGAFLVDENTVYFSNFSDQRMYKHMPSGETIPVTPESSLRYADGIIDHHHNRIICICEDHSDSTKQAVNSIISISLTDSKIRTLVSGNDFYSSPEISPDGKHLVWLTWNHPDMPWDYTELWMGDIFTDGSISQAEIIAGSAQDSICQPRFSPDGTLYFISERTGWWNLYRWKKGQAEPLYPMAAEFGSPQWLFGISNYAFEPSGCVICTYTKSGNSFLAIIDPVTKSIKNIDIPYTSISSVQACAEYAILLAGSASEPNSIIRVRLQDGHVEIVQKSSISLIDPGYLSIPETIEFPTENNQSAYAYYYPPKNHDYQVPTDSKPPLLIFSHGGPTSAASSTFNLTIQFWTSRGFAVADVNYRGSTGYGRDYRRRLNGQWGIIDVDDCVNCARYLIRLGKVDAERTIIRGGSAGGYTTLAALTFHNLFKAGASYYGVSDLEALEIDTHKFESHYLDRLVGPYPARRDLFLERSPINHVDRLSCPVIFFQGNEDKMVPPSQAEIMVNALRQKGLPVAYLLFEGEQHGFRQAGNIKRAIDAELYFYARIFGFKLQEPIEPVIIENLK
jgi:dipeptidyl aminopeptidase/acylaminoacyl peptidase